MRFRVLEKLLIIMECNFCICLELSRDGISYSISTIELFAKFITKKIPKGFSLNFKIQHKLQFCRSNLVGH